MQFLIIWMLVEIYSRHFFPEDKKMYNVTSLVKSIEEVANNTAPFPTTADHNGLSHFTGVRTSFPTEDMLSML